MVSTMNDRQNIDPPDGTIYLTTSGSRLYGTNLDECDRDEMGVYVESPDCVTGLKTPAHHVQRSQDTGVRSGPGDLDRQVYGLRKFATLAANGNPTVLLMLFVPRELQIIRTPQSGLLQENTGLFLSKQAGHRFIGYLDSQRNQLMTRNGSKHTNRPELVEKYGYDVKFAYHAVRLGIQGIELMRHGNIALPMSAPDREVLLNIRRGGYSYESISRMITGLRFDLDRAIVESDLPDDPGWNSIDDLCHEIYISTWRERGALG